MKQLMFLYQEEDYYYNKQMDENIKNILFYVVSILFGIGIIGLIIYLIIYSTKRKKHTDDDNVKNP